MCCNWLQKIFGGKNCCQHAEEKAPSTDSVVNATAGQEVKPEGNHSEHSENIQ
ncbi:MAG: hypothetical protein UV95_C0004G0042 [Candidatus Falkowbacteria bacterium GW2011_GWF2_43_32]|nr:MAG: hypothetical protein UV95_C0004G0042 [Candidatus Falkowbacteria bacterium GW2011_GWF2_43_32]